MPRPGQPTTDPLLLSAAGSSRHNIRCGLLQTLRTWLLCCIFRGIAQSPDPSISPPSSFGQKISQQLHLHSQLCQLIVLFFFFADRFSAGASLGTRNVSSCQQSFFPSLSFHQALHLSPFQTIAGCDFAIGLPLIMSLSHNFNQLPHLCVFSRHTENLLSQFLFYDRKPLFSFVRCLGDCPPIDQGNFRVCRPLPAI